jgi:arsenate reductase (glutaredoxin)
MLTIYGIPACNTMKKTFEFLQEKDIPYVFHNYKKQGISAENLSKFVAHLGLESVFNKQGTTYKKLSEEEKNLLSDPDYAFKFLLKNNSAIKRPVITDGNRFIAGFNSINLDEWLNN